MDFKSFIAQLQTSSADDVSAGPTLSKLEVEALDEAKVEKLVL